MSVTEHAFGNGRWDLALRRETPRDIAMAIRRTNTLWIAHTTFDDGDVENRPDRVARYGGVITDIDRYSDGRVELSGENLAWWVGSSDGKQGPRTLLSGTLTGTPGIAMAFATIWGFPISPVYVQIGTIQPLGVSIPIALECGSNKTRRELFQDVALWFDRYFRINPDMTIDVGDSEYLWGSNYPILTYRGGLDPGKYQRILDVGSHETTKDMGNQSWVFGAQFGISANGITLAVPATGFWQGGLGGALAPDGQDGRIVVGEVMRGVTNPLVAFALAEQHMDRLERRQIDATVNIADYYTQGELRAGCTALIYDPTVGLVSTASGEQWDREELLPVKVLVEEMTWPISPNMSVWVQRGRNTPMQITRWIEPQSGATTAKLSEPHRPLWKLQRQISEIDQSRGSPT